MGDDSYKSLPTFEGSLGKWPTFLLKFRTMLESKDLLYIIDRRDDDTPAANEGKDAREIRVEQGKNRPKNDAKVRSLFINKLSEDALNLVEDLPTAYEMVQRLVNQYQSTSAASVISRLDKLLDIRYKAGSDMSAHIGAVNSLINQIKRAGGLDLDKLHMVVLLRSMPVTDNWNVIVTSLKSRDEKDLTKEVIIKAFTEQADENGRDRSGTSQPRTSQKNAAFNSEDRKDGSAEAVCFGCGKPGHYKRDCKESPQQNTRKNTNGKFKPKGGAHQQKKGKENYAFTASVGKTEKDTAWLKDSGASRHYTWDRRVFSNFKKIEDHLLVGNGSKVEIEGVGDVLFSSTTSKGEVRNVTLRNVFYAPDMCVNLLSTAALDDKGISESTSNGITVFKFEGDEVMCAHRSGNKWIMDLEVKHDQELALATGGGATNELWHKRLCHLGYQNMEKLSKLVDGFKFKNNEESHTCAGCINGKMSRRPFKSSTGPRARHPMDILHLDVNVINTEGREQEKYLLMITDDHSGCRFGFPMKTKSGAEILEQVLEWLPWAERMTDRRLKAIRHDNAKEFVEGVFGNTMRRMGFEAQLSVAYEHEQNGMAENTTRRIMDKSRSILLESGLEKSFWPDAVQTAVFACNRSPHRGSEAIPMEKFSGNRMDISNLRVFGSWCWARKPAEKLQGKNKLDSRAELGRFIGYANGGHAYRVMLWGSKEVIISTNVRFDESASENPDLRLLDVGRGQHRAVRFDDSVSDDSESEEESDAASTAETTNQKTEDEQRTSEPEPQVLRRSSRIPKPTRGWWLADTRNPVHFAYRVEAEPEEDPKKRQAARDKEIATIKSYGTWRLEEKPPDRKSVSCKWVDTIKKDGTYKSRLVVRGFTQIQGVDFFDTFAPVAKPATVRLFMVICNHRKMVIHQSDVTAAYLNGEMDEVIYMEQPAGYVEERNDGKRLYCRLVKALYGTKQAGRAWRKVIKEFLLSLGFKTCIFDPCLFIRGSDEKLVLIIVWVDDLLIGYSGGNKAGFDLLLKDLSERFNISDLGQISDYVGMTISRDIDKRELQLSQRNNIDKMCKHFEIENQDSRPIPIRANEELKPIGEGEDVSNKPFRSLIGCLLYPSQWTRPDISYAVGQLSQFLESPTQKHWEVGLEVLRYLLGTKDLRLVFKGGEDLEVSGFADSNFAADLETGKSIFGYSIFAGGNLISWKSKKSKTTATSTTMAELEALYQGVTEGIWVHQFLCSLGMASDKHFKMFSDNMAVVKLVHGEKYLDRTKHEVVRVEFLRDKIRDGTLKVEWISTDRMVADIFTKGLAKNMFGKHVQGLKLEPGGTNE